MMKVTQSGTQVLSNNANGCDSTVTIDNYFHISNTNRDLKAM